MTKTRTRKVEGATRPGIAERLATLAESFSLSEIARRTDTPLTNVHRYFSGGRVPAEFCSALVTKLGVNPGWLLAGEGMPMTADITAGTSAMAGDLLELVEAMNAVTHMRLGALTGRHHLGVLRELNDALVRFEDLRGKLGDHSRPVFVKLLDDLEKTLNRMDVDHAGEILRACEQVRRLCNDEDLALRLTRLRAHYAYLKNDPLGALEYQRKAFRNTLSGGVLGSNDDCEEVARLVMLLGSIGRGMEALRMCEAAMLLAGDEGRRLPGFPHLACLAGSLMVSCGRLFEGLELLNRWSPRIKGNDRRTSSARDSLTLAMLYAGLVEPNQAFELGTHNEFKAQQLTLYGILREDAEYLTRALEYWDSERVPQRKVYEGMRQPREHGAIVRDVLNGEAKGAVKRLRAIEAANDLALVMNVFETQLHRLLGKPARARKSLEDALELEKPDNPLQMIPLIRGLHLRNLLLLTDEGSPEHERARRFFEDQVAAGYEVFRFDNA